MSSAVQPRQVDTSEPDLAKCTIRCVVKVDPRYYRPVEVDKLPGDPTKAKDKLGWSPRISFRELIKEMLNADHTAARPDRLVKSAGFNACDNNA